ncbi:calcium-activated chloride channel regulator 1-like [Pristis pectinata]|uniref:calcium-activated chloride channel regulator 1-like n=1 Tax=Pristis pectinata TaxID=685728 RepID=UPI00223E3555|nr:calcium-activated chloride channel regulator 1-like [Pristis pectinata]XP_051866653.1 calcium-activated chloride channel regulator 1-like [Pristis pectinata]XP_051866654.1 calcium-activated chloride channel regulator 1-like [Pristis pectinata]
MVLRKTFDLVFSYLLCAYVESNYGVKIVDNGYRDIVIAIKPSIPHNDMIHVKIQEMMKEASSFLHRATKNRLYFSDVKILLPSTWPVNSSSVQGSTTQSYEKADVIIAEPHPLHGDTPYTLQYGGCGEKGRYIHLTPNFILNDSLVPVYGKIGWSFVHEWAHLQWGVFNEYDDQVPFYRSGDGSIEATRCSKEVKGSYKGCRNDKMTGLPDRDCKFNPDKNQTASVSIMYIQGLENVVEFCNDKTHNTEAPNRQNTMCNCRSTWDVISTSEDFRNISSPHTGSVIPTLTFLQAKDRVLCLVLDVSGSMTLENRTLRLRQASEIFLLQVVETRSRVGIVTFSSNAEIKTQLKKIDDDRMRKELVQLLPMSANGGTNICAGIRSGFEVLRGDDRATSGDEIVLLTDGEDDKISDCFTEVEHSGAIIHTIALGPTAAKELEQLSVKTGGLQFAATDKVDTNGLIDAFTGLVSGNGDISQQSIQLESSGRSVDGGSWFNGTVAIDKTVGNNTHFVLTWEDGIPDVFVRDPSGKIYSNSDFDMDDIVHTARLEIDGTAQTGTWTYSIMNPGNTQKVTITVTSRAADEKVPPVTVNAKITRKDSTGPVIIYVEVSQGFLPVLFAKVTIIAELPNGLTDEQELLDDGSGADNIKNDGVYSKYFLKTTEHGRYNFKVRVEGKEGSAKMANRTDGNAMYIPGYTINGIIHTNPPRPPVSVEDSVAQIGDFSRVKSGGALSIPPGTPVVNFAPCRVTDLQATILNDEIELQWTAPGADLDQGTASYYEMRMSDKLLQLRDSFSGAELVNLTNLKPRSFGSKETFKIIAKNAGLRNRTMLYFALRAYDEKDQSSEMSNIARISVFVPLPKEPKGSHVLHSIWIAVVVAVIVCLIVGITDHVVKKKCKSKRLPEAVAVYRQVATI